MIIKHNKKDITDSVSSLEEVLELQPGVGTISLILEQVERRGGVSRGWTLHIKTLTGRIFDVEISNPQVYVYVCVYNKGHLHTIRILIIVPIQYICVLNDL